MLIQDGSLEMKTVSCRLLRLTYVVTEQMETKFGDFVR